jgi:PAS domain S-box-containing protein
MELENQDLTEVILDSLGEGLFTVDQDFKINSFNRAAEKILGISKMEALGQYCKNVFKTKRCMGDCPLGRVLETGSDVYNIEGRLKHGNGSTIPVKINAAVLKDKRQNPIGGVISFRDMSYLEKIQKQLITTSSFHGIVGQHKSMQEIFTLIEEVKSSNSSVFITGESGTGKELIANAFQELSLRKNKPFVKINCSVFPPQLLASELFGHVKGSFTDAVKDRIGRFELANKGTIFLDEIAEMPLQMQVQLLRVLQEGTFERIGESITRKVDVRVIAATNCDIENELRAGKFREDLYYRLNVIPVNLPPLRERRSDVPHLVQHFINKFSLISGKKIKEADDEAMDLLLNHQWPGNIRELENCIEYAFARSRNDVIHASKLPPSIREGSVSRRQAIECKVSIDSDEYHLVKNTLIKHQWNRTLAAKELEIGRTTLWRKMKALGLAV